MNAKDLYKQQGQSFVAFFMSDLHLRGAKSEDIERLVNFVDYLNNINSNAQLFLVGDIFDFWFGDASPVKAKSKILLEKLSRYNKENSEVIFFEGNHDVHLFKSLTERYGFEVVPERKIVEINNKKIVLEHGDLFDPEDKNYLFLRRFLRKNWLKFLSHKIVPDFIVAGIGYYFSKQSSKTTKVRSNEKSRIVKNKFRSYANRQLKIFSADVFIAGHTHERLMETHDQKTVINLGSWFDEKWILGLDKQGEFQFYQV